MRYCLNCGAEIAPDDVFCPYCGIKLTVAAISKENSSEVNEVEPKSTASSGVNSMALLPEIDEEPETLISTTLSPFQSSSQQMNNEPNQNNINTSEEESNSSFSSSTPESDSSQTSAISNFELKGLASEADIPFEEMRESEPVFAEQNNANTSEPDSAYTESFAENSVEDNSETNNQTQSEAGEFAEVGTLISQTPQEKPESSVLISNPNDVSVPRANESNPSQDTPGSKSPKLKPLADGTLLNNRYEIVRKIGGGGMGAVYLAKDRNLGGVDRAVKEMIQAYVDETQHEKAVEDFRREALLLSSLEHPAIPTIYDYFVDQQENRFYLVMKYISGGDLAARFRAAPDGVINEPTMTEWAIQIADVLDYLHNLEPPIVYRDLKPSNVMIDGKTGRVMIVDFGIARWVNKEEKGVTAVGTMGYAPSEQYAGNAEPRSDIYALGATMFHLLTGSDPQNNPLLIFDFTKHQRPRQINPNLSVEMEQIIMRAVEYNATLRYSSAAEMRNVLLDHLERIRAGRLTFTAPETANVRLPAAEPTFVPPAAPSMAFCGFCGERIAANDMFCAYCGSRQPEADRVRVAAPAAFPVNKATARLVVETGTFEEPAFELEKESNIIGREDRRSNIFPEVDLTRFDVSNPKISRRHARIWRQGATFMVEDLGSANGTTLVSRGNKTVKLPAHQPHILTHGDKLRLGETTVHFFVN